MKIRMVVTLDVDPDAWELDYGVPRDDLRDDVREYVRQALWAMPCPPRDVKVTP